MTAGVPAHMVARTLGGDVPGWCGLPEAVDGSGGAGEGNVGLECGGLSWKGRHSGERHPQMMPEATGPRRAAQGPALGGS